MLDIRQSLREQPLLFDGAMGTYLAGRFTGSDQLELADLLAPEEVSRIHAEYLAAGARAIKTNTFGANRANYDEETCLKLVEAGWRLASEAAGDRAWVFADIGPVGPDADPEGEYCFLADRFLALGARHFLFETNSCADGLHAAARHIRQKCPEAFVMVSFAALPDGFTRTGHEARQLLKEAADWPETDAVGLNCVCGAAHMRQLAGQIGPLKKHFAAMPNAGYPTVLGNRTFYTGSPEYFAMQAARLTECGVGILGGCCGTTPAHIAALSASLAQSGPKTLPLPAAAGPAEETEKSHETAFWTQVCDPDCRPFAVELDPPDAADVSRFMKGAEDLQRSGAALISIADCPIARARMDSSMLACRIHRELGMEAMPHMTCRDRNLNAIKALLLGLCAEDVHDILTITGDPIPTAERDEIRSVFNFNSRRLAAYIRSLSQTALPVPFRVFGALNVNARNFDVQLRIAKDKEESGISCFFTQPVLTRQGFENLQLARQELQGRIMGGIIPVVSQKNALFMENEVPGIRVDPKIIAMYEGADRAAGEDLATAISAEIAMRIRPYVDGFYLMTPFGRTGLVSRIMAEIRAREADLAR